MGRFPKKGGFYIAVSVYLGGFGTNATITILLKGRLSNIKIMWSYKVIGSEILQFVYLTLKKDTTESLVDPRSHSFAMLA